MLLTSCNFRVYNIIFVLYKNIWFLTVSFNSLFSNWYSVDKEQLSKLDEQYMLLAIKQAQIAEENGDVQSARS